MKTYAKGEYICWTCKLKTVTQELEHCPRAWDYDRIYWHTYTCSKCGGRHSVERDLDTYEYGDTVYVE